jgi:hypothetical protein
MIKRDFIDDLVGKAVDEGEKRSKFNTRKKRYDIKIATNPLDKNSKNVVKISNLDRSRSSARSKKPSPSKKMNSSKKVVN